MSLPFIRTRTPEVLSSRIKMVIRLRELAAQGSVTLVESSNATSSTSMAPADKPAKDGTPKIGLEDSVCVPYVDHVTLRLKEHWNDVNGTHFAIRANIKAMMTFDAKHPRRI
jgi:hypothetical protein